MMGKQNKGYCHADVMSFALKMFNNQKLLGEWTLHTAPKKTYNEDPKAPKDIAGKAYSLRKYQNPSKEETLKKRFICACGASMIAMHTPCGVNTLTASIETSIGNQKKAARKRVKRRKMQRSQRTLRLHCQCYYQMKTSN
eukprot:15349724-Ditylum_brightwellii.AAC.1